MPAQLSVLYQCASQTGLLVHVETLGPEKLANWFYFGDLSMIGHLEFQHPLGLLKGVVKELRIS